MGSVKRIMKEKKVITEIQNEEKVSISPRCVINLYNKIIIKQEVVIPFIDFSKECKNEVSCISMIYNVIKRNIEGKCIVEGYVKPQSTKIVEYSSGKIIGKNIVFNVVFESFICNPLENSIITCQAKVITQAGIKAISPEEITPIVVYISRDHHNSNQYFNSIKENDMINIRIISKRYELNDKVVSIIGELVENKEKIKKKIIKKLILHEN